MKDTYVWCINLDRRTDKWHDVQREFNRVGIDKVMRFMAYDTKPGWKGCATSHLGVMEKVKYDPMGIVFEDDVRFLTNDPCRAINKAMLQLPDDWDMLYLGGSPQEEQVQYSSNLFYARNILCMHAYIINNNNGCIDYVLEHRKEIAKIDAYFAYTVQSYFKCFIIFPNCAVQKQFQSDTCNRSDVSTISKNYQRFIHAEEPFYSD
jgi:GR25 family glycosyltransferase involved in LPS biosynthesis